MSDRGYLVVHTDDAMSLLPQVLVLLFTHHLHPGGDGPPRQVETPADQRAAGQTVGAQQHGQQLQPEGQSHMRLRDGGPPRQRKHLGQTNLRAGVWAKQMKSVYLTKNQKTIGRSENPNRQKSR